MNRMTKHTGLVLLAAGLATGCDDDASTDTIVQPELRVSTLLVDFGEIQVGTSSARRQIILENVGGAALELDGVVPGQPFLPNVFSYDPGLDVIQPGAATTISANFSPTELGAVNSVLIVRAREAPGRIREVAVELRGTGVTSQVTAHPERLDFGNVVVNTAATRIIKVQNTSNFSAPIEFLPNANIEVCGTANISAFCLREPSSDFVIRDETFDLGPGDSRELEIRFRPTVANAQERASFTLRYCAQGGACEIDLSITGFSVEKAFSCEPQALDFGAVNPGSSADALVNCSATANQQVTVTRAYIGGNSSPDFAQSPEVMAGTLNPPTDGNPGGSLAIPVSYSPGTLGDDAGILIVETDDEDPIRGRVEVRLQGSGGGPDIEVSPRQLNFGLTSLLAPSKRSVLVSNVGFQDLRIEIDVDSDATGVFSSKDAVGDIIGSGDSRLIEIEFAPTAEQVFESLMVIESNDQDEDRVEVRLRGEGINLPACQYEVAPNVLNFGTVEINRTGVRPFEIRNLSQTSRCLITSLSLNQALDRDMVFQLPEGELTEVFIEPGAALGVPVSFSPTTPGTYAGRVDFSISNPDTPFNTVALAGSASESTLLIVPNDLFFGTIEIGCSARAKTVTVYNTGATPAEIFDLGLEALPGVFSLRNAPRPPFTVAPGGSFTFDVSFTAPGPRPSDYTGAVEIVGSYEGQDVTYIVSLQGSGAIDAVQIDEFDQLGRPEVDILFVVDDSCSMSPFQQALGENFDAFIQFAEAQALDYHIAVTATERGDTDGRFFPLGQPAANRVVTPRTAPSPRQVFLDNVNVGARGGSEVVFDAAYNALTPPLVNGHNAGFLRREAVLSIIALTDEREQSQRPVDFFLNFFLSIKGFRNTNLFSFSAIHGGETGCGQAQAGPRVTEMVQRSGGVEGSICTSDWARTLEDLSQTAVGFNSRFFLTNQPVIQTLEVLVDDDRVPATEASGQVNWTYDFSTNSVNFLPLSVPGAGSQVRIEYTAECL
ncbi:MAG: choice-of-anchor D domain-containing protein [Myxococcota bacterium]